MLYRRLPNDVEINQLEEILSGLKNQVRALRLIAYTRLNEDAECDINITLLPELTRLYKLVNKLEDIKSKAVALLIASGE